MACTKPCKIIEVEENYFVFYRGSVGLSVATAYVPWEQRHNMSNLPDTFNINRTVYIGNGVSVLNYDPPHRSLVNGDGQNKEIRLATKNKVYSNIKFIN